MQPPYIRPAHLKSDVDIQLDFSTSTAESNVYFYRSNEYVFETSPCVTEFQLSAVASTNLMKFFVFGGGVEGLH
jgi:hypothetical protein